jgi:hypothetical protein
MLDILERSKAARLSVQSQSGGTSITGGPVVQVVQSAASNGEQTDSPGPLEPGPQNPEWSSGPGEWTTSGGGPLDTSQPVHGSSRAKQLADNGKPAIPVDQLDQPKNGTETKTASEREPGIAACLSRLRAMPYPADIDIDRWALFLADAAAFLSLWGPQTERTGWRASDLFAVPGGLCWALEGREVVALSIAPSEATIRAKDAGAGPGATVAFHCPAKPLALP